VPAALKLQGDNYKLVALSNADDSFLDISIPKLGAEWHAVFTAEQAGAYKPRLQAFEYMLDTLNAKPEDFLHVSPHPLYDHIPMYNLGFRNLSCWTVALNPSPMATTSPPSSPWTS
jgi:2-haloacid dehalogenase